MPLLRFKCIDLDGNGILTRNEMQFFYEEQLHRMECMAQEPVLFEDILCQIIDMICPEVCLLILRSFYVHPVCLLLCFQNHASGRGFLVVNAQFSYLRTMPK